MDKATLRSLSARDQELLLATRPKEIADLDEDALGELHARVRRARNRYSKLYRRQAAEQVKGDKARGLASKKTRATANKTEVFEDALARVSRRLAAEARRSADALKAERLAAARGQTAPKGGSGGKGTKASAKPKSKPSSKKLGDAQRRSPIREKTNASTRAKGKRRQAKRDAR